MPLVGEIVGVLTILNYMVPVLFFLDHRWIKATIYRIAD